MESSKLPSFRSFCETEFKFTHRTTLITDGRANPDIPASTIVSAITFMGALGLGSLLSCDQMLRTFVGLSWFRKKKPVVSDTTMARSLETMEIALLRPMLYDSFRLGRTFGMSKCPLRAGSLKIGIVDGSTFGRFEASCFEVVGASSLMVDLERIPKRVCEKSRDQKFRRPVTEHWGIGALGRWSINSPSPQCPISPMP